MDLDLRGHPIHARALSVTVTQGGGDTLEAAASLLDLRKRGFCPVGSELQGMGIVHHMELHGVVDRATATIVRLEAAQPTVAFEASPATRGESCRDPIGRLVGLHGAPLGERFGSAVREAIGGVNGCAHIAVLAQFLNATVTWVLHREREAFPGAARRAGERIFRRDLVFDGNQPADSALEVGVQLGDLHSAPAPEVVLAPARFGSHHEVCVHMRLDGWPATFRTIHGARRLRRRDDFADAVWEDLSADLTPLLGMTVGSGSTAQHLRQLDQPPLRDALLMLMPALIQCRAAFPDKWLGIAVSTPQHAGLVPLQDSCYMWRRGSGLERVRQELQGR